MTFTAGARLGPYEILSPLGAGGMGEVYRARDSRLGRAVAVKVISRRLTGDPGALARFQREARVVASLSHPNIVALHDVGTEGGVAFAVMELLEGEPLDRHLGAERMPWTRAVDIAASIADALACAHDRGVVHRDLKPANIFVTDAGVVKILDFGLARQDPLCADPQAQTPAVAGETQPGVVVGTVDYMAPEQVRGEPAEPRSDLFSLACVLYEMLCGRRPFEGRTAPEVQAAILRDQPGSASDLQGNVPPALSAVVHRCLEKRPEQRFQSARDLAFALRQCRGAPEPGAERFSRERLTRRVRVAFAALGLAVVSIGIGLASHSVRSVMARPAGLTSTPDAGEKLTVPARPVLPAAVEAYVRGRHAWEKRSEADLREAIRDFQASIDADPTYAPAYAGLADAYGQLGYGSYVPPEESFPLARAAATHALELDPTLAGAHASLGYALMYYEWNFDKAEAEYRSAIKLNPNVALAHQWYAYLLTARDRPASEAEGEIAKARTLDPLSVPIYIDQAYILHYYARNDEALHSLTLALEMKPEFPPGWFWLGRIYTSQGRYREAESALQNIGPLRTWTPAMAVLGYLYGKSGRTKEALDILAEFDALARSGRYASSYAIAIVYAGIGDRERALSSLEAAYRERSHWLVWLKRDPRWDGIRHDPRFQALVRRVGLPS